MADGGSGTRARHRGRRDGRRPRARRDRRGRAARRRPSSTSTSCSSGPPDAIARAACRAARRRRASSVLARARSHRDGRRARDRGAHARRTRRSCAAPRPCATGGPQAMVGAGQHRRDDGRRAAAHAAGSGACTGPRSRCRSRCPATIARSSSSTAARPSIPQPEWLVAVGRAWAASTRACGSASTSRRSALLSNGEEAGQGRRRCARRAYAAARRGEGLRRQRRGPRPHARRAPT